ncbi:hypothetical protein [Mucilaginibacter sp. KACC 22063]|uniref:hypothetical protein n=1 Tax=Mucilaginibacter sp. KACC 22063 TaxID=3025666 RepID=UPI002366143A|nr:hypothetical protein [Mucilaginibacter sp. KACC 22063]WDF54885.1 hypothetical protein PQ461_18305 [Mucilaginibacter sp. KACC 22063]
MPVLTRKELSELNPEKIYNIQTFVLHHELWANIDPALNAILNAPVKLAFDSTIRTRLGALRNSRGIYMFFVEPEFPFIPSCNYFMYVGRVISGNTFFKRFYDYVSSIGNKKKRRNLQLLTNLWPGKTWVYFFELNLSDTRIAAIEANLFDNIVPPLNNQFRAKRALNSRSIYN